MVLESSSLQSMKSRCGERMLDYMTFSANTRYSIDLRVGSVRRVQHPLNVDAGPSLARPQTSVSTSDARG